MEEGEKKAWMGERKGELKGRRKMRRGRRRKRILGGKEEQEEWVRRRRTRLKIRTTRKGEERRVGLREREKKKVLSDSWRKGKEGKRKRRTDR